MQTRYYLNDNWKFCEEYVEEMTNITYDDSKMVDVRIPHTCKELPYHYFDESEYQMLCGYRKMVWIPREWQEKVILVNFEGVAHDCEVYVNEKKAGEHHCGYTAFTIDITKLVQFGKENLLTVKVDSRETLNIPPFGNVIDYMTYGGIYRDVSIEVKEKCYIKDIFLHADISNIQGDKVNACDAILHSHIQLSMQDENLKIHQTIQPYKTDGCSGFESDKKPERRECIFELPVIGNQMRMESLTSQEVANTTKKITKFDLQRKVNDI